MNEYYKIDLRDICNHKLIYDKDTPFEKREGLDGIYINLEDMHIHSAETFDGVEFDFNLKEFDNVICNGQSISVGMKADRLHIIGFSYWGDANDYLQAIYNDNDIAFVKVHFLDWSHRNMGSWDEECASSKIKTVQQVISSGEMIHIIYFHCITVEFNGTKTLTELVLPDNFWLHIFAMTLEKAQELSDEKE